MLTDYELKMFQITKSYASQFFSYFQETLSEKFIFWNNNSK